MKKNQDSNFSRAYYFIGIGGVGMSATALIAKSLGCQVNGSDSKEIYPPTSTILRQHRIKYFIGYRASNLQTVIAKNKNLTVVVGGGESEEKNPEIQLARRRNLPVISFPQLLGELTAARKNIVVTGAHGKTSTTALAGWILDCANFSPTLWVGGNMLNYHSNVKVGQGEYCYLEGDEYRAAYWDNRPKFSYYHPDVLVIHNLAVDHFDVYKNLAALIKQFSAVIKKMPASGLILANGDDKNIRQLCRQAPCRVIYYGFQKSNNYHPRNISAHGGKTSFALFAKQKKIAQFSLPLPGLHNILNALPGIIIARELGVSQATIQRALRGFQGITRRLEKKGVVQGVTVIDDYAHNPAKIKAALAAVRLQYPLKRIWAVFEPHTYSRTYYTLPELKQSFGNADRVVLLEIYAARERGQKPLITGQELAAAIAEYHPFVTLVDNQSAALKYLLANVRRSDIVVVMTVGSTNALTDRLVKALAKIH